MSDSPFSVLKEALAVDLVPWDSISLVETNGIDDYSNGYEIIIESDGFTVKHFAGRLLSRRHNVDFDQILRSVATEHIKAFYRERTRISKL